MSIRMKKIIATLITCMLFSTTVYAVSFSKTVYQTEYMSVCSETKNNANSYATITTTSGPTEDSRVFAYMQRRDNTYYVSGIVFFDTPGTKSPEYFKDTFNPSYYTGKTFDVMMRLDRTDPIVSVTVTGKATP